MLKVQYAGPKVEISNHGVKYNKSKEDKYIYLMVALEILKDIDNDYEKRSSYSHHFENNALDEKALHEILQHYESELEENVKKEEKNYDEKIQQEINNLENLHQLTDIDKEVWINNIELMKAYRIQRAINKIYYEHCIENIARLILDKKIKKLITPFNKIFFHVLNSIKNLLSTGIHGIDTKLVEKMDADNNAIIVLTIGIQ